MQDTEDQQGGAQEQGGAHRLIRCYVRKSYTITTQNFLLKVSSSHLLSSLFPHPPLVSQEHVPADFSWSPPRLYRVELGMGYLELPQPETGVLSRDVLGPRNVYVLDAHTDVFVWLVLGYAIPIGWRKVLRLFSWGLLHTHRPGPVNLEANEQFSSTSCSNFF